MLGGKDGKNAFNIMKNNAKILIESKIRADKIIMCRKKMKIAEAGNTYNIALHILVNNQYVISIGEDSEENIVYNAKKMLNCHQMIH